MVVYFSDSPPTSGIMYNEENTTLRVNHAPVGCGTVYLTETTLCWFNTTQNRGFSIPWKNVIMHAITSTPDAAIYMQVDFKFSWENATNENNENGESEDDEPIMTEMWLLPENKDNLNQIYQIMNECQIMNPDEENKDDSGGDSDFEEWHENGGGDIERLSINDPDDLDDDGQFEDAE
ncbi:methylosome subunit pICln-like [Ctenocephalides felis]|uniref:methylosome subunit pICln-like n=2 Tax=Ctenocephalides felis TaxID=7515 RepID=UPI000E6E17A7|nr:methylosome subunit pICln-like [Ctenocephalides felis]